MTTAPLVPADVDLRDFAFMPLDVARLRDSKIVDEVDGEAFRAAILLWCAAWHQVPAGSLPNDDVQLAKFAGYGRVVSEWLKVKEGALYGFILCSDGRLYHPVIAEKAIEAWEKKAEYAERSNARTEKARAAAQARWGKDNAGGQGGNDPRNAHASENGSGSNASGNANASNDACGGMPQAMPKETGTGTGRETGKSSLRSPREDAGASARKPLLDDAALEAALREASGLENDPSPNLHVVGPIHALIGEGYDLEKHILPVLRSLKRRGKRWSTWQYVIDPIRERNAVSAAKPGQAPPAPDKPIDPEVKRQAQLSRAKEHLLDGRWSANAGPRRGEPGCRIPEEIWQEAEEILRAERAALEEAVRGKPNGHIPAHH